MLATSSTEAVTFSFSVSAVSPRSLAAASSSTSRDVSSLRIVASRWVDVSALELTVLSRSSSTRLLVAE